MRQLPDYPEPRTIGGLLGGGTERAAFQANAPQGTDIERARSETDRFRDSSRLCAFSVTWVRRARHPFWNTGTRRGALCVFVRPIILIGRLHDLGCRDGDMAERFIDGAWRRSVDSHRRRPFDSHRWGGIHVPWRRSIDSAWRRPIDGAWRRSIDGAWGRSIDGAWGRPFHRRLRQSLPQQLATPPAVTGRTR